METVTLICLGLARCGGVTGRAELSAVASTVSEAMVTGLADVAVCPEVAGRPGEARPAECGDPKEALAG